MIDDEAADLMKRRGTYLVPTAYLLTTFKFDSLPPLIAAKAKQVVPLAQASHRRAIRAGVKIAFGTDAAVYPHGDNARELATIRGIRHAAGRCAPHRYPGMRQTCSA